MRTRALIAVFAKPPQPGQVKTRLAAEIQSACPDWPDASVQGLVCALAQAFVDDTWALLSGLSELRPVLAMSGRMRAAGDYDARIHGWSQGEGDLGQRLCRVLRRGLEDHAIAIALGADSPGLCARRIVEAIKRLETGADAVLGPCEDGGFYLLGLRRCPEGLLGGIRWSQQDTREQTRNKLEAAGLVVQETPAYFDVDRLEDLRKLWRLIESAEIKAKETQRVLEPEFLADLLRP